jgi:hypothetical protein
MAVPSAASKVVLSAATSVQMKGSSADLSGSLWAGTMAVTSAALTAASKAGQKERPLGSKRAHLMA